MKRRIWVSYDLGLKGDFPGLYRFLDNHDAQEIGNSSATFIFEAAVGREDDLLEVLKTEIQEIMNVDSNTRLYVICATKDHDGHITRVNGKFLLGRRKSNPWKGYGDNEEQEEEWE